MSKMGQEFEKNLDNAKYEVWEALKAFLNWYDRIDLAADYETETMASAARKAIDKVEKPYKVVRK